METTGGKNMAALHITKENFQKEIMDSEKTVLLDFFAAWCAPCRMLSPVIEAISEERDDVTVGKVDIDEEMELAQKYQVMSIPTLIVIKGGEVVSRAVGATSKDEVLSMLA